MYRLLVISSLVLSTTLAFESFGQHVLEAKPSAVLLRNGEVLSGRVTFEGDYCALVLSSGELRLRRDQVAAVESSVEQIFVKHIVAKSPSGVEGNIYRADWCLQNDLLGYAANEITEASRIEPRSRRVVALGERLAAARRPRKPKQPTKRLPAAAANDAKQTVTNVDARALETFTVAVQPLLLNRCANAACHGSASDNGLRLVRGFDGRPMPRSLTLQNLAATLSQVNRQMPAASPLLSKPIRPHANGREAVFLEQHRKQYDLLARWVESLAQDSKPATIISDSTRRGNKPQKRPAEIDPRIDALARPLTPRESRRTPDARKPTPADRTLRPIEPDHDPYDPTDFNRRYHPQRIAG
ncbi:MAG: hypothetical protein MI757_16580 [Pirellulales bacterium]|nr:hypothetical protein [Pirellulales bacterium]